MRFLDGATEAAVGVLVWVRAKNGLAMEVRYATVNAPDQVAMTMTDGQRIFRQFSGSWLLQPLTPSRTRAVFRYHFTERPPFLSKVLDPIVSRVLTRDMDARLVGLQSSAEKTDISTRLPAIREPAIR